MDQARRHQLRADMVRLADGDRAAFDPVFAQLSPAVRSFCRQMVTDSADSEDAAQEALIKIFGRVSEYDRERDALTWALAIAAWECRTARKRASRSRQRHQELGDPAGASQPEREVEIARLRVALGEVLAVVSAEDVESLMAAAGLTDRPELSPATFRKRLQRARERARLAWRSRYEPE